MADVYETFVRALSDLHEGRRAILVLRDLTPGRRKYFAQHVLATVARDPASGGEWRPLRVRSMVGNVFPGRWYVRGIQVLPPLIPGAPYMNAYDAMDNAWAHLVRDGS
jgi:hypothetical protein